MTRFHDFDRAWEETEARRAAEGDEPPPPIPVRFLGEEWELPGDMPAALTIRAARLASGADSELTLADIIHLTSGLVPSEILDRWLERGVGERKLGWVLMRIAGIYMGVDFEALEALEAGDEVGEGQAAGTNQSSSASSNGGRSSKRTSKGSTRSTSTKPSGK